MPVTDPKLQTILTQLQNFGFIFYGFDESRKPLVTSPNGQVIEINLAINFVNEQIRKQREATGGSIESGSVQENLDTNASKMESSSERAVETKLESALETQSNQATQKSNPANDDLQVKKKAPEVVLTAPEIKPYGEGFDPKSFNKNDITQVVRFIEENSKKAHTSSNKWIAKLWQKFMDEMDEQYPKN